MRNQIIPCPEVMNSVVSTLKKILTFIFTLLLLAAVVTAIVSAYQRTTNSALELSRKLMLGIGDIIIQRTDDIFAAAETQLETNVIIATSSVAAPNSILHYQDDWLKLFWRELQLHDYISSIFLADTQGNMLQARKLPQPSTRVIQHQDNDNGTLEYATFRAPDYSPLAHTDQVNGYDPRTRPWYPQQQAGNAPQFTPLYRFESTGKLGITVSRAYFDTASHLQGVFGADISLDGLSDFLNKQTFGRRDMALIINDNNELVAYPTRLKLTNTAKQSIRQTGALATMDMLSDDHAWVAKAWKLYQQAQPARRPYSDETGDNTIWFSHDGFGYAAVILRFRESFGADWSLLLVAPEEDLLGGVKRSLQENMTMTATIVLLFLFILYLLFGRKREFK
ncbi:cache domain-containing protein [Candidatus Thiothrix sp. Deng01]|uniref:Cache domain-containing protein n=1 Tax=Candidatus Thiothrix phosphatis TaxID=3112415 RepID=A0ABU6D3A5_9GAMM|nr:cache domain-containing protein [Candidatus Thiothrix sp. Deng01]MEB4593271.1 cache domain-containing protein [Candidatus Thiothrix sp. Deng01]